jgi:hypothetical protein
MKSVDTGKAVGGSTWRWKSDVIDQMRLNFWGSRSSGLAVHSTYSGIRLRSGTSHLFWNKSHIPGQNKFRNKWLLPEFARLFMRPPPSRITDPWEIITLSNKDKHVNVHPFRIQTRKVEVITFNPPISRLYSDDSRWDVIISVNPTISREDHDTFQETHHSEGEE